MERDKMLEKLHSIKAISTNIVATYDMGLQFDVMTGEGVTTNIGNVGSWPYLKIPITEGIKAIKERVVNGEDMVSNDILKEEIFKELLTYCNMCTGDARMVEDRIIEKKFSYWTKLPSIIANHTSLFDKAGASFVPSPVTAIILFNCFNPKTNKNLSSGVALAITLNLLVVFLNNSTSFN